MFLGLMSGGAFLLVMPQCKKLGLEELFDGIDNG